LTNIQALITSNEMNE